MKSQLRYEAYRLDLKHHRKEPVNALQGACIKIKREIVRLHMGASRLLRFLRFGPLCPAYGDEATDVIHSPFHPFPEHIVAENACALCVQTVQDVIPHRFPEFSTERGINRMQGIIRSARQCDVVLVPSEATKIDLLACGGFDEKPIEVTPLAADPVFSPASATEIADCRAKFAIPVDREYFLSVSTLEPRKNFPFLLKAFRSMCGILDGKAPKPLLVLTGTIGWGDSTQHEIRTLLEEMGDLVVYTGYVTDRDLRALYSGALSFLMPSLYEGFGLPLLEAMACGTPVISSNASSMPEVVGDAGIMLSPYDESAWVSAMSSITHLGVAGHAEASKRALERSRLFSWERTALLTREAYERHLAVKKTGCRA
jgi:glycosyltransferase involved in cell wall biosynthesis